MKILVIVLALFCCFSAFAQNTTFWPSSTVPGTPQVTSQTAGVTVGLRFTSTVNGTLYGVRFYKGTANTGVHVGNLWSATGTKLATVTFPNETSSGWQQANFPAPYSIVANTVYVVSCFMPVGRYSVDMNYAWSGLNRPPLRISGSAPGVYAYGSGPLFPAATYASSNYYVDVNFRESTAPPPVSTFSISGTLTGVDEVVNLAGAASGNTITSSARTYTFLALANGQYLITPVQEGFTFDPVNRTVHLNGVNITGVNFVVSFKAQPPPPPPPSTAIVDMAWTGSTSSGVTGHNVYRKVSGQSSFLKINNNNVTGTSYADATAVRGSTYVYVVTATNSTEESPHSNETTVAIP